MTVILVLLCLAIAGRELYTAFDKRQPRLRAEVTAIEEQLDQLRTQLREVRAQVSEHGRHEMVDEPVGVVTHPITAEPPPAVELAELRERLERLETELRAANGRLAVLESAKPLVPAPAGPPEWDRSAQHGLARSLDSVEEAIGTLQAETLGRLEHEAREGGDTVSGLLYGGAVADRWLLTSAYEQLADDLGLRIRVRESAGHGPWRTGYYLSGRRPDEIAEELFTQSMELDGPRDGSVLAALLVVLGGMSSGIAQIGSFVAVRTPEGLRCGVLTDRFESWDAEAEPATLESRLAELSEIRRRDLTRWFGTG